MWNLKNKTNERMQQNRNKLTDIENKLMVTSGGMEEGRGKNRGRQLRGTNHYV